MDEQKQPLINPNPILQEYYESLESRVGYKLFLGGTRHFGYYPSGTKWPFPINGGLRRMEERLFRSLNLPAGARVLDAGCGVGHVALYMARKGLRVLGIDVVQRSIIRAQKTFRSEGLSDIATARVMDYHHLEQLKDESFDGVYTMETLVHATDADQVLSEFFRVLKPGGSLSLYEYDRLAPADIPRQIPKDIVKGLTEVNVNAAMPANEEVFIQGVLESKLQEHGFENVRLDDLSDNVMPFVLLFAIVAYIPYFIIRFFGLQKWFVNTQAAVNGYWIMKYRLWRYVAITATKTKARPEKTKRRS